MHDITQSNLDESIFEIPSLGSHYSQQWAKEDLSEEGKQTAKLQNQSIDTWHNETGMYYMIYNRSIVLLIVSLLNDGILANKCNQEYGPLTQKLMAVSEHCSLIILC